MANTSTNETLYDVLHIHPTSSHAEIKAAYHRLLLTTHPDKQKNPTHTDNKCPRNKYDLNYIREAYRTLADPASRSAYDSSLRFRAFTSVKTGPRPAQVVSLEDFDMIYTDSASSTSTVWTYACRCGGQYTINEAELENDLHLIACERCSETIHVGYEAVDEEEVIDQDG